MINQCKCFWFFNSSCFTLSQWLLMPLGVWHCFPSESLLSFSCLLFHWSHFIWLHPTLASLTSTLIHSYAIPLQQFSSYLQTSVYSLQVYRLTLLGLYWYLQNCPNEFRSPLKSLLGQLQVRSWQTSFRILHPYLLCSFTTFGHTSLPTWFVCPALCHEHMNHRS